MPDSSNQNRVSRFTLTGNTLGQEQIIYTWQHQRQECCHTGGSLEWGANGDLYISTGDNTNPFAHGFNPTDERPGRAIWDAQRTSANTNDPNGKILRIRPIANATGVPGVGTTYTIPPGQHVPRGHGADPARDLRHGLPEPVPDQLRQEDRLDPDGRLRPGRRLHEPEPRPAGLGRVERGQAARLLRLALLHP